jgi:hypothetical protein
MEGPGADSEEKHEPASDIDTAWMDSLKVLDPEGPIREADIGQLRRHGDRRHDTNRQSPHLCKVPHLRSGVMAQARPATFAPRR